MPMAMRDGITRWVVGQLRRPRGLGALVIGRAMNRANAEPMLAAAAATRLRPGETGGDLGFGGGLGLGALLERVGPQGRVFGIDSSPALVRAAGRRYRADVAAGRLSLDVGELTSLPLATSSVDALMTVNMLYYADNPEAALAELKRVVKPGGRVVIGLADPKGMGGVPYAAYGYSTRPVAVLAALAESAGFTDVRDERVGAGDDAYHLLIAR